MPSNFEYFLLFFREKVSNGEKQVAIATSPKVNKSTSYINKLFKGNPKSCPIETQKCIADYFNISLEDMIKEGREIFERKKLLDLKNYNIQPSEYNHHRSVVGITEDMLTSLKFVASGVIETRETLIEAIANKEENQRLSEEILLYKKIFAELDEDVTFYNAKKEVIFSSNRWGFLNEIDIEQNPSFDTVVLNLRYNIVNFEEVLNVVLAASKNKSKMSVDVEVKTGDIYHFKIIPIYNDEVFLGSLLINTLKKAPKVKK